MTPTSRPVTEAGVVGTGSVNASAVKRRTVWFDAGHCTCTRP